MKRPVCKLGLQAILMMSQNLCPKKKTRNEKRVANDYRLLLLPYYYCTSPFITFCKQIHQWIEHVSNIQRSRRIVWFQRSKPLYVWRSLWYFLPTTIDTASSGYSQHVPLVPSCMLVVSSLSSFSQGLASRCSPFRFKWPSLSFTQSD